MSTMKWDYNLRISLHRATMLPQKISADKMRIRVSAVIELDNNGKTEPRRQESDSALWNSKPRNRDVYWTGKRSRVNASLPDQGDEIPIANGVLNWKLTESELKYLKTFHPKLRIYCYATKMPQESEASNIPSLSETEPLGWMQLDVRDLQGHQVKNESFSLKGVKGEPTNMKLDLSASLQIESHLPPPHPPSVTSSLSADRINIRRSADITSSVGGSRIERVSRDSSVRSIRSEDGDALAIGKGSSMFDFEVTIDGANDLLCLAPELEGMGLDFWFSYEIFGVVLQSECFHSLSLPNLPPTTDAFRLKGSLQELEECFDKIAPLQVYLCSNEMVIGSTELKFPELSVHENTLDVTLSVPSPIIPQRLGANIGSSSPSLLFTLSVKCNKVDNVDESVVDDEEVVELVAQAQPQAQPLPTQPSTPQQQHITTPPPPPPQEPSHQPLQLHQQQHHQERQPSHNHTHRDVEDTPSTPQRDFGSSGATSTTATSTHPSHHPRESQASVNTTQGIYGAVSTPIDETVSVSETLPRPAPQFMPFNQATQRQSTYPPDNGNELRRMEEMAMTMAHALAESKLKVMKETWKAEWEQWQIHAEKAWTEQLRMKELAKMRELEEGYAQKEKDRSALVARSVADYTKLETKLRAALTEIELKERKLAASELELKQAHAQKLSELQLLQRRLREDSRHQVCCAKHICIKHFVLNKHVFDRVYSIPVFCC
jgi:hypothetical protein